MVLRRYTITVADLKSGIERRATVSVLPVVAVIVAAIALPGVIAFATARKADGEMQRLSARHRALEIETANYRAALAALVAQIGSGQSTNPDDPTRPAGSPQSARLDPAAGTPIVRSDKIAATPPTGAPPPQPDSASPATDRSVIGDSPAPTAPTATDAAASATSAAVTPASSAAVDGGRDAGTAATGREAITEALAGVSQARVLAEVAQAPALASRSYETGVTLELEAQELSTAGRMNDALARAVEAGARFRAAEIEARAEAAAAAAWERLGLTETPATPTRRSLAEAPEPPVSPAAGVEETILDVIAQYVRGLETRNLAALKRVWPSLGGSQERAIQTEFENARTLQAQFTDPRITINGDTTTVTGFRMYSLVTHDGQRLSSVTRTTMTLRRSGDGWVIERVVHQQ